MKGMIVEDSVYEKQEITDPLVIEIINSKAFQRLKGVKQAGITSYVHPKHQTTRYDHCLGAYFLLRMFNASREEQIAGLLHDLPHTAFSHVSDLVFGDGTKNYHEEIHEKILMNSEIPAICKKYGFDAEMFVDETKFHLLEQSLPDLCADRLDYFLRDALELAMDFRDELKHIKIVDGKYVFDDEDSAVKFALGFKSMNEYNWENPYKCSLYLEAANILKLALREKIIEPDDFLKTDREVLDKIEKSSNAKVKKHLTDLKDFVFEEETSQDGCLFCIPVKARYIDPLVLIDGKVKRLTEINKSYNSMIKFYKLALRNGYKVCVKNI